MGISKVNFKGFILFTTLGSIPWTLAFVYVGYALGNNWIILNNFVKSNDKENFNDIIQNKPKDILWDVY